MSLGCTLVRIFLAPYQRANCHMTKRPASVTQADIARAIRAAQKAGLAEVEVKISDQASIRIPLVPEKPVAESEEIVL
jgi:anion-transporting  ArsA/GET3 family ATPase